MVTSKLWLLGPSTKWVRRVSRWIFMIYPKTNFTHVGRIKLTALNKLGLPICEPTQRIHKLGTWSLRYKTLRCLPVRETRDQRWPYFPLRKSNAAQSKCSTRSRGAGLTRSRQNKTGHLSAGSACARGNYASPMNPFIPTSVVEKGEKKVVNTARS